MSWLHLGLSLVTRPTDHMILTRYHSHDLLTWSQHATYLDIKSLSIITSASLFLCHNYIWVSHLSRLHYFYIFVSSLLQYAFSAYCGPWAGAWRSTQILVVVAWEGVTSIAINKSHWKITSRSTPIQIPVMVAWEGVTSIAINESHWWELWWVVRRTAS